MVAAARGRFKALIRRLDCRRIMKFSAAAQQIVHFKFNPGR
ncbi:hypothetical protein HDE76_002813 [Rhodanobacter sp. ANJX3]|jgi:hypothetical protein|nr:MULTISPECIES: hypothetical protein [unclassified Rhodanobacter]MBB5359584.1 hypothetical protein [Rhodanobacter sp. ANJX3]NYE30698.1 hypothetical protein [Rhodanobacter sp. K2T2]